MAWYCRRCNKQHWDDVACPACPAVASDCSGGSDVTRHSDTLEELVRCAGAWEAEARLLGNLRAADIKEAISEALRITRELGEYSYSLWDDENFRDGYRKVNSGLIVDASKFHGGRDG